MQDEGNKTTTYPRCRSHHLMFVNASNVPLASISVPPLVSAIGKIGLLICGDCGYTEFHTQNHEELWEEWSKKNR